MRSVLVVLAGLVASCGAVAACSSSSPPSQDVAPAADAGGADAVDPLDDPPIDPKYQAFAAAFDAERAKLGAPGAAVALLEHGEVTFAHGFGAKGPSRPEPVRARTLFRIGSMTKALTATAMMSLVDEGKVDLAATLKSVAPEVALTGDDATRLTLHQLLSQQSGLYDYLVVNTTADDGALASFLDTSFASHEYFMAPPGTFWNYANPNFYLAGLVVERAGGALYRDAMTKRVLQPLGMTRTFFLATDVALDGDATNGKSTDGQGQPWDVAPGAYDNAWARPAGFAFSNVLDYARFVRFLYAGDARVISDASRAAMQAPQVSTLELGDTGAYGYGLFVAAGFHLSTDYYATKLVYHGGDIPGWAGDFFLVPETGFGMVVLANADAAHFASSLVLAMKSFASLPAPSTMPAGIAPDPATFAKVAGDYDDPHNVGRVTVTVDAQNVVTISMPDLDAAKIPYDKTLTPSTRDTFVLGIEGASLLVTFVLDPTGAPAWLRTRVFVAQHQPATQAGRAARQPMHVDPTQLRARLRALL